MNNYQQSPAYILQNLIYNFIIFANNFSLFLNQFNSYIQKQTKKKWLEIVDETHLDATRRLSIDTDSNVIICIKI